MARRPNNNTLDYLMEHFGIPDFGIAQSIIDSCARFPNASKALDHLRRQIGPPPSSLNVSQRSPGFQEFPQILEALWIGMMYDGDRPYRLRSACTSIQQNWPVISSWLIFSMEHLFLAADSSRTVHRLFWIIPLFLKLEGAQQPVLNTRNATPNIRQLIGRVWFASIERNHPSWGRWSELLLVIEAESRCQGPASLTGFRAQAPTFTRHISQEANRISIMPVSELEDINYFLQGPSIPSLWGRGPGFGPFTAKASMDGGINGFVRALSNLVCKRRSLRDPPTASPTEYSVARAITSQIFDYLTGILQSRFLILEALESGLIPSLIKANPAFFMFESEEVAFDDAAVNLLRRISAYLPYPGILHEVLCSVQGISDSCEASLGMKSKKLWMAWQELKGKALVLRGVRRTLKTQGIYPLCAVEECPSIAISQCAGCSGVVYCSSACQKLDWRRNHRTKCLEYNQHRKTGIPTGLDVMDKDEQFISGIVRESVTRQNTKVAEMIRQLDDSSEHIADSTSSSEIPPNRKTYVAVFDLNTSEIPSIEGEGAFILYRNQGEFKQRLGPRKIDDPYGLLESVWTRTPENERGLLIVILVPQLRDVSLALMARLEAEY
ncbi:hypothetical protein AAF712_012518 [Marasmius tenuissimus]|uniref:MYND-type domain-containing protein n=1 Tax=Marasmius tenuissimus TaxID=585030 RepID=A0ABR2ZHJ9_9AGAR